MRNTRAIAAASALFLGAALATAAPAAARATSQQGMIVAKPKPCSKSNLALVEISVGPPGIHASGTWNNKEAKLVFALSAAPSFGLKADFSGDVTCSVPLPSKKFPIVDAPGLVLKITPELTFSATGKVGADFTWHPSLKAGFTVSRSGFSEGQHSFTNGNGIDFTGSGDLTIGMSLHVAIETAGGAIGVEGVVGPSLTASITTSAAGKHCWKASASADASFDTFVDAFGLKAKLDGPEWKLGSAKLSPGCSFSLAPSYSVTFSDTSSPHLYTQGSFTKVHPNSDWGTTHRFSGMLNDAYLVLPDGTIDGKLSGNVIAFTETTNGDGTGTFTGTVNNPTKEDPWPGWMSGTYTFTYDNPDPPVNGTWVAIPTS
jgi:hypothetical protein